MRFEWKSGLVENCSQTSSCSGKKLSHGTMRSGCCLPVGSVVFPWAVEALSVMISMAWESLWQASR